MYNSMVSDVKVKGQRQWACAHNRKVHVVVLSEHSEAPWRMSLHGRFFETFFPR